MKKSLTVLAAVGCLAMVAPTLVTPASAAFVTHRFHGHHNRFGHGCRTIHTVVHRRFRRNRVIVRRHCS